jgi:hypothetical protein
MNCGFRIGCAELAFGSVVDFGLFLDLDPQSSIRHPQSEI